MTYFLIVILLVSALAHIIAYQIVKHQRKQIDELQETINGLWLFGTPLDEGYDE